MNTPDIKRFITGFLVLAFIASSTFFIGSNFLGSESKQVAKTPDTQKKSALVQNGFIESVPNTPIAETFGVPQPTSTNLTDYVSAELARQILKENPEGPTIQDGIPQIEAPSVDTIATNLINTSAAARKISVEKNLEELIPEPTRVIQKYTSNDVIKYLENYNENLNSGALSQEFQNLLISDGSDEAIAALRLLVSQTIIGFQRVAVPQPLLELHRATLRPFVALKDGLDTIEAGRASNDPVEVMSLLEWRLNEIQNIAGNIAIEAQRLQFTNATVEAPFGSRIVSLLGLSPTIAHAQGELVSVPVSCIGATCIAIAAATKATAVATAQLTLWQKVIDYAKKIAREILKDRIIHNLVAQTVKWIQGNGKPQFVTDWSGFLRDTADVAAGSAISAIAPGLCRSFGPLVQLQLESTFGANPPGVSCTIERVVQNVKDFYNNFGNGGWIAFGQSALPDGNFFWQLFQGSQIVEARAKAEEEAAAKSAQAGNGFLSTEVCVQQIIINEYKECLETAKNEGGNISECNNGDYKNEDVKQCVKYQETTPGAALGHTVYNALGAPIQRVVNAEDVVALTSAIANALITKLIGLGNDRLDNKGLSGVKVSTTTINSDPTKSPCYGLVGAEQTQCIVGLTGACSSLTGSDLTQCVAIMCGGLTGAALTQCQTAVKSSSTGGSCAEENCNGGNDNRPDACNCRCRDNLSDSDFCFINQVEQAKAAVLDSWKANQNLDVGLIEPPFQCGGDGSVCNGGPDGACVADGQKYAQAVSAQLATLGLTTQTTEELEVTGQCTAGLVTNGTVGPISTPRTENYALSSSGCLIRHANFARAVCKVP